MEDKGQLIPDEIITAAIAGDVETLRAYLTPINANYKMGRGQPFIWCCINKYHCLKLFIEMGAEWNITGAFNSNCGRGYAYLNPLQYQFAWYRKTPNEELVRCAHLLMDEGAVAEGPLWDQREALKVKVSRVLLLTTARSAVVHANIIRTIAKHVWSTRVN